MRLEDLKKGFWGYRKEPVFQYLTQIEDACARKLREREEQMRRCAGKARSASRPWRRRTAPCGRSWRSCAPNRTTSPRPSWTPGQRRAAARGEPGPGGGRPERVRRTLEEELGELRKYQERIAALREAIRKTLEDLERQAEALERESRELAAASPAANLSLFQ